MTTVLTKMKLLLAFIFLFLSRYVSVMAQVQTPFITQIRDLVIGAGASFTAVQLHQEKCGNFGCSGTDSDWTLTASNTTDVNGRIANLVTADQFPLGNYKLVFKTGDYYGAKNIPTMYPYLEVIFTKSTPGQILIVVSLSPYGYSVYKGVNTFK